ncbi:MAG: transcriptional repressor [Acetobacteraceae bacterium]|jgi:Fur family zinc uptake transcriptional regulator|nr:transcriptional repressor [Roseomonas sp.]MCA3369282.1 transcriptional repressor [Roseomonas sp.]MCE2761400.1 transcriptional repressor [Acetobacteraceae bacterium]
MHDSGHHLTALERAEALCQTRGVQLTPLRREVLRLVLEAEAPIGAYALLDQLKASRAKAAPPTVYRALDFLLEQGLIHRLERLNAFMGCAEALDGHGHHHDHAHDHPHQFLICRGCGATREISDHGVAEAISAAAAKAGFSAARSTVEIEGYCGKCGDAVHSIQT